jgi:hypothetical protein
VEREAFGGSDKVMWEDVFFGWLEEFKWVDLLGVL